MPSALEQYAKNMTPEQQRVADFFKTSARLKAEAPDAWAQIEALRAQGATPQEVTAAVEQFASHLPGTMQPVPVGGAQQFADAEPVGMPNPMAPNPDTHTNGIPNQYLTDTAPPATPHANIFEAIAAARQDPELALIQDNLIANNGSLEDVATAIHTYNALKTPTIDNATEDYSQPGREINNTVGPAYGLSGAESAVRSGLGGALAAIDTGVDSAASALRVNADRGAGVLKGGRNKTFQHINQAFNPATQSLQPYQSAGSSASGIMADITGANGPEAQARAYENFQNSPGYKFAFDQAMKGVKANAAATGGLGGGRVLEALQDRAAGLASQEFGNYTSRVSSLADRGMQANNVGANLASNRAGLNATNEANYASQFNANQNNLGGALASLYANAGGNAANTLTGAGNNLANMRYNTGVNMANMTSGTSNSMANQTNQYGVNLGNLMSNVGTNMSNLLTGGTISNANQLSQLGALLANLSQGQGAGQASIDAAAGRSNAAGIVDSAAGMRSGITDVAGLLTQAAGGLPPMNFGGGGGVSNITPNQWMYGNF